MQFRSSGFCCAIVILLLMAGCATPNKDALALEGRWRNVRATIYFSDSTTSTPTQTRCSLEFSKKQAISECATNSGPNRIVSNYRFVGPRQYESVIVEHKNLPHLVGTRVRTDFRIENGALYTTSYPSPPEGAPRFPIKIEATWARD